MDCQWPSMDRKCNANATRKMRVVPVRLFLMRSASQAQSRWSRWSRRSRLQALEREAARCLPRPPARRQDGGAPEECRWKLAGRPRGISFSSGRAGTTGTAETTGKWQARLARQATGLTEGTGTTGVSPVAWSVNGLPVDCRWTVYGLPMAVNGLQMDRKCNAQDARCPSAPIPDAERLPGAIPVVSVVPAVSVAGAGLAKRPCAYPGHRPAAFVPRSGLVPAQPTARRQDGGAPYPVAIGPRNDKGRGLRRALRVSFRFARKLFPLP